MTTQAAISMLVDRLLNAQAALPNAPAVPSADPFALAQHVLDLEARFNFGRPFPAREDRPDRCPCCGRQLQEVDG